jgi:flagellar protein FliS
MRARITQAYVDRPQEVSVEIAKPAELLCMMHSRILEHLSLAIQKINEDQNPHEPIKKSISIIEEGLQACLNRSEGGDIADSLDNIYDWALQQLLLAQLKKEAVLIEKVREVFVLLAQAWDGVAHGDTAAVGSAPY